MILLFLLFAAASYCLLQGLYFPTFNPFKNIEQKKFSHWKKFLILKKGKKEFLWLKNKKFYQKIVTVSGSKITTNELFLIKENILFVISIIWVLFLLFGEKSPTKIMLLITYSLFFFFLPSLVLQIKRERREKLFNQQVPYFIDLFILSVQSGMNIEQAFIETAKRQKSVLAFEVLSRFKQIEQGVDTTEILAQLREKIENEEWNGFLKSILQAKKLGTSLAKILELQVNLIRLKRKQKAEEFSRTASVKIVLPLVLFIFPALLLIYIGPGILHLMG